MFLYLLFNKNNTCREMAVLIVLTVGMLFEPLVTVSKKTFKADNMAAPATTKYHFQTVDIVTKIKHKPSYKHLSYNGLSASIMCHSSVTFFYHFDASCPNLHSSSFSFLSSLT